MREIQPTNQQPTSKTCLRDGVGNYISLGQSTPIKLWGGSKKKIVVLGIRNAQKNARKVVKTIQILAFFTISETS